MIVSTTPGTLLARAKSHNIHKTWTLLIDHSKSSCTTTILKEEFASVIYLKPKPKWSKKINTLMPEEELMVFVLMNLMVLPPEDVSDP